MHCWSMSSTRSELLPPFIPEKMNGTTCGGIPARKESARIVWSTLRCSRRIDSWRVRSSSWLRRSSSALAVNQYCMYSVPCHWIGGGGNGVDVESGRRARLDGGGRPPVVGSIEVESGINEKLVDGDHVWVYSLKINRGFRNRKL